MPVANTKILGADHPNHHTHPPILPTHQNQPPIQLLSMKEVSHKSSKSKKGQIHAPTAYFTLIMPANLRSKYRCTNSEFYSCLHCLSSRAWKCVSKLLNFDMKKLQKPDLCQFSGGIFYIAWALWGSVKPEPSLIS